jgi:Flp pilus assembly protein TadG
MTTRRTHPTGRVRGEGGGAAVELVLLTPLLVALLLLAVLAGRLAQARAEVGGAARDAARAASVARSPAAARAAAHTAAAATLAERRVTCQTLAVATDTRAFRPGGRVAVRVGCAVDLGDLALLGVPGARTLTARFVAPLDTFRETRP